MKKTFTKFLAALMLLAIFTPSFTAMGQTRADKTVTWTATNGGLGTSTGTGTINTTNGTDTYSWSYERTLISGSSYTGWTSNCIQLGKNGGVENLTLTTSAIPGTIKSVSVECSSYQGKHNVSITVDGNIYLASTATASWTTVGAKTGTGSSSGEIAISFTGGTRALYIKSITVIYENSGSTAVATTTTIDATGITNTDIKNGTAAGSLSATVKDNNNTTISGASVTWSGDNDAVATINASTGAVTLVGMGTVTFTASYAGVENQYQASSSTYEMTVTDSRYVVSDLTFTAACNGAGTADDGAEWTVTSDGIESTYEETRGIHYGTGKAAVQYIQLSTSDITGTIAKIVVNAATGSGVSATVGVTVGGSAFGGDAQSLSTTATNYTFTGSAQGEIIVTVTKPESATGALYVKSVIVYYIPSTDPSITASDVELAYNATSGDIVYSITNEVTGAAIAASTTANWITLPGSYTSPITFTCQANTETTARTATVTLNYVKNSETLATKDVTITQEAAPVVYTSISTLYNEATSTATDVTITFNNWVVTGVNNSSHAFVSDGTNGFMIYASGSKSNHGFNAGDVLSGTVECRAQLYNGALELTELTSTTAGLTVTPNGTVTTANIAMADLAGINTGALVSYQNLTCEARSEGNYTNYYLSDGETEIQAYKTLLNNYADYFENGKTYNITGVFVLNNSTKRINPRNAADIVEVETPSISADNVNIVSSATGGSISYTINHGVEGGNLTATIVSGYTISNLSLGSPSNGTIAFTCDANTTSTARTAEITLAYTYGGSKTQVTATITITQAAYVPAPTSDPFVRISSLTDLTDGSIVVIAARYDEEHTNGYKAMPSTMTSSKPDGYSFTSTTSGDDEILPAAITDNINGYYWVVNISEGNYRFTNANGDLISYGNSGTDFTTNGAKYAWSIARDTSEETALVGGYTGFVITNATTTNRGFASNGAIFAAYSTSNIASSGYNFFLDLFVQKSTPTTATYYYSVNGTLGEAQTCAVGSTKTLETGTDLYSNFTFAGWTTAAHDVSSPISSYTFQDANPVTFYAVYTHNSNNYTRVFNETATSDIIINGPSIIPSFATLNMGVYNLDYLAIGVHIPYVLIEEGGQMIYHDDLIKMVIQKNFNAPTGTWGEDDNTGWYTFSSPDGSWSKLSEHEDFTLPAVGGVRQYDLYAYEESFGWYNKKNGSYINSIDEGVGYLYARAESLLFNLSGESYNDDVDLTNLSYTSRMGTLAGLHCIGNPYTHNIYKGVGITGDMAANYYALNEATGAWISTTDATPIPPMHAILVFVNKTDGTAAIHMTSDNSAPSSKANNDYIKFTVANSQYEDVAYAWFDKGEGLNKINHRNSEVPMIYIPQGDVNYSIAPMADNTQSFNLNFKAMTTGKYTLSYKTQGEFNYMHIYDRLTGEDVDMLLEGEYSFIGSQSDNDARFIVRLGYTPNYDGDDNFVYQNGNDLIVNGEGELQIFDVMGRMVKNTMINGVETIAMPQGVYVCKLNGNVQKIVVR